MKTVLIITYYWPPAGGPGVQRVLKFAKYLPDYGWRPIILTVENGEYPAIDESLAKDIPNDLVVHKTASLEVFSLYRKMTGKKTNEKISTFVLTEDSQAGLIKRFASYIRGNFLIPDARIGWRPFAIREGMRIINRNKVDLIFSTAPPMSTHLVAKMLAKKNGLPWAADFRDPWTEVFYYHNLKRSKAAIALDERLEKSVLTCAQAVITVSPFIQNLFKKKAVNKFNIICNGYDTEDFQDIEPLADDGNFHVVHAGHLAVNQNPEGLWAALKNLVEKNDIFRQKLRIDFYGSIHSQIHESLFSAGLRPHTNLHDYVAHDELVAIMKRASLLFFVIPVTHYAKGILTSKLFDYMGANRPILGIGPEDGDAAAIVKSSKCGILVDASDGLKIARFIKSLYHNTIQFDDAQTISYTRQSQAKSLADIFDSI